MLTLLILKPFWLLLCSVNSAKKRNKEKVAETYDDAVSLVFLLFSFCNLALFIYAGGQAMETLNPGCVLRFQN